MIGICDLNIINIQHEEECGSNSKPYELKETEEFYKIEKTKHFYCSNL